MKLILAIISADAVEPLSHKLTEHKYSVTQISSVGGFLRRGSTTVVIGVDDAVVAKKLVEVLFEVVLLRPVKFWKVDDEFARS